MITAAQMRAARAIVGLDQKALAERAGVSLPTIQRMEASDGTVRGVVDTLMKVIQALDDAGVYLIPEDENGGRGGGLQTTHKQPADRRAGGHPRPTRSRGLPQNAAHHG